MKKPLTGSLGAYAALQERANRFDALGVAYDKTTEYGRGKAAEAHQAAYVCRITAATYCPRADVKEQIGC